MMFGDKAAELSGFAAAFLGWRPAEFWSATPAELAAALGGEQSSSDPISLDAIGRLRKQFPDERER